MDWIRSTAFALHSSHAPSATAPWIDQTVRAELVKPNVQPLAGPFPMALSASFPFLSLSRARTTSARAVAGLHEYADAGLSVPRFPSSRRPSAGVNSWGPVPAQGMDGLSPTVSHPKSRRWTGRGLLAGCPLPLAPRGGSPTRPHATRQCRAARAVARATSLDTKRFGVRPPAAAVHDFWVWWAVETPAPEGGH